MGVEERESLLQSELALGVEERESLLQSELALLTILEVSHCMSTEWESWGWRRGSHSSNLSLLFSLS
jgi:hypothetical protein